MTRTTYEKDLKHLTLFSGFDFRTRKSGLRVNSYAM
jgi:hypothetical protein